MRHLPLFALFMGILLFFILVGCDENAPGSSEWNSEHVPAAPLPR